MGAWRESKTLFFSRHAPRVREVAGLFPGMLTQEPGNLVKMHKIAVPVARPAKDAQQTPLPIDKGAARPALGVFFRDLPEVSGLPARGPADALLPQNHRDQRGRRFSVGAADGQRRELPLLHR